MFYRFTLAAVVAATTLTGCAAHKSASTTASVSEATQATDAPVAATPPAQPAQAEQSTPTEQSAQTEQPAQPAQTQPITAPGAVTESTSTPVAVAETQTSETAPAPPAAATTTPAPAKEEKISAAEGTPAIAPFSSGPTQIDVSHIVTRADDGSSITLTIDGTEAGLLKRGEKRAVFVEPGKHKVGGYVQTLFGLGRVTIPAVEITTVPGKVKNVSYSVTKTKPAFREAKDSANAPS